MTSQKITEMLRGLLMAHRLPSHLLSDNGPEFVAKALRQRLKRSSVEPPHIEPESPCENGYEASFHLKVRDEFLGHRVLESQTSAANLST